MPSMNSQLWWQVVKRLWEYIKAHDLQNPKDKRKIVLDEQLGTLFKPPLNMLNMNKQLSRHVYVEGEDPKDMCCKHQHLHLGLSLLHL